MKDLYLTRLLEASYLVVPDKGENASSLEEVSLIMRSFLSLGFTLSAADLKLLETYNEKNLTQFYETNYPLLKNLKGEGYKGAVFFKNFPDFSDMSVEEMYVRQILHYLTRLNPQGGFLNEDQKAKPRLPFAENYELTTLKLITKSEALKYLETFFKNAFEGEKVISYRDSELLIEFFKDYNERCQVKLIPFKENIPLYLKLNLDYLDSNLKLGEKLSLIDLSFIKTATDFLRVYAYLSGGNSSLVDKINFISLDRMARRIFASILNNVVSDNPFIYDELSSHEFYFKRAFEKLHLGEFSKKYPLLYEVLGNFRNDRYKTFNSQVLIAVKEKKTEEVLRLLSLKPGYFARMLDYLLRSNLNSEAILNGFSKVVTLIQTPTLISLWEHFKNRNQEALFRSFLYRRGDHYNARINPNTLEKMDDKLINKVIFLIEETLKNRFSTREIMENVYLDPILKNYTIPTNNKNAVGGFKTLAFGSRVKMKEDLNKPILRFFTHWKNKEKKAIDIDLSLEFFDKDYNYINSVAWHSPYTGFKINTFFSGDITNAPKGAFEYIDLNYLEAKKYFRYVVATNVCFTGDFFSSIPECFSGVMLREDLGKTGEIFEAKSVTSKWDLIQKDSNVSYSLVIDLETLELIWVDLPRGELVKEHGVIAATSHLFMSAVLQKLNEVHFSLYDLFLMHERHLKLVNNKLDAKIILSDTYDATLRPTDFKEILTYL